MLYLGLYLGPYSILSTASLVRVIGVIKAVIKITSSTAIGTTGNTAVKIAGRISGTASSGVKAVAKEKVEVVNTVY